MNNVSLYKLVCSLKDRLENHPDSSKDQIIKATYKVNEINAILNTQEWRKK